ncbi:somatostatin receptor type 2-like isoform X2 [Styela clava]
MAAPQFEAYQASIHSAENILFPLISVLGILFNAFVVLVIVVTERSRSNRTVANTFVMNLAIADILFLIALPFHTPSLYGDGYPYTVEMCKLLEAMKHVSYHSSILFLTGMSVDRYMAIVHSLRSLEYRTQKNARIACFILWIASIITSIPILVYSTLEVWTDQNSTVTIGHCIQLFPGHENEKHFATEEELLENFYTGDLGGAYDYSGTYEDYASGRIGEENMTSEDYSVSALVLNKSERSIEDIPEKTCLERGYINNKNSTSFRVWQYFTFIGFFVLPALIVMFCYFKIWRATTIRNIRSQNQRLEGGHEQQSLHPKPQSPKQDWKKIQSKVTIMVACLVSAFILCWFPFQLWIIITLPPGVKVSSSYHCDIIIVVVTILAWANSLLNPILYSITSENFRKRAMTTLLFIRYGSRRTLRMSATRTSRTTHGRTEKTDLMPYSMAIGTSPKTDRRSTYISQPTTPIDDGPAMAKL